MPPLFALLPAGLFGPLASTNREHYWQILYRLYDEFFGPDAPMPPSIGLQRREITSAIERYLLADDPWEREDGDAPDAPLSIRANTIYERFRVAGWLRQERFGAREMTSMPPVVSQILALLVEFCERGPTFLSAKVRSIELQMQQVVDGKAGGDALDEAADQARRLLASLSAMSLQVRDLMPELSRAETTAQFVRQLFERYVGQLFVGDYASLHKADHPMARRTAILAMAGEIESTPIRRRVLDWYRDNLTAGDADRAEQRLQRSLRRLRELDRLDEYLGRLDDDLRQANRRALAFLDYRLRAPDKLDTLLRRACRGVAQADEADLRLPVAAGALMDESRLRPPRQKSRPIPRSANALREPTPEQLARLHLLRRIKRARQVTPEDLANYVGRVLDGRSSVASDDLAIVGIEDFRAYQALLTLALRAHRRGGLRREDPLQRLQRGFRVELIADARSGNTHLRGARFVLHRAGQRA